MISQHKYILSEQH